MGLSPSCPSDVSSVRNLERRWVGALGVGKAVPLMGLREPGERVMGEMEESSRRCIVVLCPGGSWCAS
jgi:hypothetical protein